MGRIDVQELSIQTSWIDGYLPSLAELRNLAQLYRHLDITGRGSISRDGPRDREKLFGYVAGAIAEKFERENNINLSPNRMWLLRIAEEPSDLAFRPIYGEFLAESKKADYYHLVRIHEECKTEEDSLLAVMAGLHFEPKPESSYVNRERFIEAVRQVLSEYAQLMIAPELEIERRLSEESGATESFPII